MFQLVIRKIISNAWKVLCLLLGSILVVGMVCSIPIYANGILQRMLTKDLENAQVVSGRYSGYLTLTGNLGYVGKDTGEKTRDMLRQEMDNLIRRMPVPAILTEEVLQVDNLYYTAEENGKIRRRSFDLSSLSHLADHVTITKGRMYSSQLENGVLEVIVSDAALKNTKMVMDKEYDLFSYRQGADETALMKFKIVGMYTAADVQDVYWYRSINYFSQSLVADPELLVGMAKQYASVLIDEQALYAAFDYYQFRIQDAGKLEAIGRQGEKLAEDNSRTTRYASTFDSVLEGYSKRESELKLTLQILIVPILLMLVFYIFMVSQLMVRSETTVISVLESRGAGRARILTLYGLESSLLGLVTLLTGPVLGLWMVRVIGASNGFLEFVNRKALKTELDRQAITYGIIAVILFVLTTLLPVFVQARTSIVQQKRKKSRAGRAPLWQRIFLDLILLAVSLYALYRLDAQVVIQQQTGSGGIEMNLDFLLFLASTLFILGAGLLFLRLYPWILRLVYLIGRRIWSPVLFASFHQIGRSGGQEQFLMIFLILSLSIGLFNANAARTINRNTEDSIRCLVGADISLQEYWQPYDVNGQPISQDSGMTGMPAASSDDQVIKYVEPNLEKYTRLSGVEHAARVWRENNIRINKNGKNSSNINLMAIDPYDFALTAWSRSDLNAYYMNEYMNVLTTMPTGVILSADLKEKLELNVGDAIIYTVNNTDSVDGVIIAFVDFWPGFQPQVKDNTGKLVTQSLLIANYETVLSATALQPYEVWLKRADGAGDKNIYGAIEEANISITSIESANQMISAAKNDPQLQGTNGALTLGFIVSMLICAIGFLIYWIMSVQGRVLQFGIFRAMGLSKSSVIGMLLCEQGMVSGVAIIFGIVLGSLSSYLYVPLFQLVYSSSDQPLPFRVISEAADANKIYLILGCLLLLCFIVLIRLILRIKIDQAVKLGEE